MQKVSSEQSSMVVGESIIQISRKNILERGTSQHPGLRNSLPDGLEAAGGQVWLRWATLQPGGCRVRAGAGEFAGVRVPGSPRARDEHEGHSGASAGVPGAQTPVWSPPPWAPHPCSLDPLMLHLLDLEPYRCRFLCRSQAKQIWGLVRLFFIFPHESVSPACLITSPREWLARSRAPSSQPSQLRSSGPAVQGTHPSCSSSAPPRGCPPPHKTVKQPQTKGPEGSSLGEGAEVVRPTRSFKAPTKGWEERPQKADAQTSLWRKCPSSRAPKEAAVPSALLTREGEGHGAS